MAEYGNGVSFAQMCNYEKEKLKQALKGRVRIGEDEDGFTYAPADKEACDKVVLAAFDNIVYYAIEAMSSAHALEACLNRHGIKPEKEMHNFIHDIQKAGDLFKDYEYEEESADDEYF